VTSDFHVVVVAWDRPLVFGLWAQIARHSSLRISHIMHPREVGADFPEAANQGLHFFRRELRELDLTPDRVLLESLEGAGIPTIHNMILGDRVVSALASEEALGYATFLARRLIDMYEKLKPSVIIGGFDSLHSGLGLAVARKLSIPWFAFNFSVIPAGLACFCDALSPMARVQVAPPQPETLRGIVETTLARFETRSVTVPAYITPPALSLGERLGRLPRRLSATLRILRRHRDREFLKFTEDPTDFNLAATLRHLRSVQRARSAVGEFPTLRSPPAEPYVLFGLHTQPESAIDVWAPFYSRQEWVVEQLARAVPPTHKLLIKIHKSDAAKYSRAQLRHLLSFPGVALVEPFADVRAMIDRASLIVSIQGTMGLEGGLLGKPVIMLGDSPATLFPSVSRIGELSGLPALVRAKLAEPPPARSAIVAAYFDYLAPFRPATHNDWTRQQSESDLRSIAAMLEDLRAYLMARPADVPARSVS
jgi:predicted secreted protein